jgi:hypothetical protein
VTLRCRTKEKRVEIRQEAFWCIHEAQETHVLRNSEFCCETLQVTQERIPGAILPGDEPVGIDASVTQYFQRAQADIVGLGTPDIPQRTDDSRLRRQAECLAQAQRLASANFWQSIPLGINSTPRPACPGSGPDPPARER